LRQNQGHARGDCDPDGKLKFGRECMRGQLTGPCLSG
jgi:hypothetical protein